MAVINRPISAMAAELLAIGLGMQIGAELGGGPFIVESDCKQAVELIYKEEEVCSDLDSIVANLKMRKSQTKCREIQFAFRESNRLAHLLAKIALKFGGNECMNREIPFEALSTLEADCNRWFES